MNKRASLVGQSPQLSGGVVAQRRASAGTQDGSPEQRDAAHLAGKEGVHARMDSPPATSIDATENHVTCHPSWQDLGFGKDAALVLGQLKQLPRYVAGHGSQNAGPH